MPSRAFKGNYQYIKRAAGSNEPVTFMQGAGGAVSIVVHSEGGDDVHRTGDARGVASIKLNGIEVSKKTRGLNVVVVDPVTGGLMSSKTYDTHSDAAASVALGNDLSALPDGVIVAIASQDEYSRQLTDANARTQLLAMGFSKTAIYGNPVETSRT